MGQESFQYFFSSLIPEIKSYVPVSGIIDIIIGGILIYEFSSKKESEQELI